MTSNHQYILEKSFRHHTLLDEIGKHYQITRQTKKNQKQKYYDTFDWRLYNKSLTLNKEETVYRLSSLKDNQTVAAIHVDQDFNPKFWWDFPSSPFTEYLKPLVDIRALLFLIQTDLQIQPYHILNQDGKIVLKILFKRVNLKQNDKKIKITEVVEFQPIRGYQRDFYKIIKILKAIEKINHSFNIIKFAIDKAGLKAGTYSSKLKFKLESDMPARVATQKILKNLLEVIKINEQGVIGDIDTEFLHDYRVAIRRTRSALSQIKRVFPAKNVTHFKSEFSKLQKLTNRHRDLDVYLLNESNIKESLPIDLQPGLDTFFKDLSQEKVNEHKKLIKALKEKNYDDLLTSWENFINNNELPPSKNSDKPIKKLAAKFIARLYQNILNIGEGIDKNAHNEKLHQLRIECKKLRYLLEFFGNLFPKTSMSFLIKQLKLLQDNLGQFNDLDIQQQELKKYLPKLPLANNNSSLTYASIGGLISNFYQKQLEVRKSFKEVFDKFKEERNINLYMQLFG